MDNKLRIYRDVREGKREFTRMEAAVEPKRDEWKMAQLGVVTQYIQFSGDRSMMERLSEKDRRVVEGLLVKEYEEAEVGAAYERLLEKERRAAEARAEARRREAEADKEEMHWHDRHVRREIKVQAAAKAGRQPYSKLTTGGGTKKRKRQGPAKSSQASFAAMEAELAIMIKKAGL